MLNTVPLLSQARNPRALVTINGIEVRKIDYIEYVENNTYISDSFHVKLPLYGQDQKLTIDYWLSQPAIMVEIFAGFPNSVDSYGIGDLQSLILGGINNLSITPCGNGALVEFDGFDLSKKFIDNKTVDKYPNYTSSQIAILLAKKRGLNPIVTATTTLAGYYYSQDYVQLGSQMTEWDLLTYLAQKEGFQIYVKGLNLYFQPQAVTTNNPYLLKVQTLENNQQTYFNGTSIKVSRNLNYARDVIVTVRSVNAATAHSGHISVTVKGTPTKKTAIAAQAQPIGEAQTFTYTVPGLNKQQALTLAQQLLQNISQHERLIEATVPGDNLLHKDSLIQLQGVSESADQFYYPDTITRRISPSEGYVMDIRAKNHSPQSVVVA